MPQMASFGRLLLITLIIAAGMTACGPRGGGLAGGGKLSEEDLRFEADLAMSRLDTAWAQMIRSDDRRIDNIEYLLNTVEYQTRPDTTDLGRIRAENRRVRQIRFNRESLSNSAAIDLYDAQRYRVDTLIGQVYQRNPGMVENYNSRMIMSEIQAAQDSIIIYRLNFDQQADAYNQLIKRNERTLQRLGPPYNQMTRQGLFRLET